ncbi:hypothetical protein MUK42_20182 [Musa troglodytarum]|uniref:Uncharacterized protein n=1 Tax=Musa troglodytarum TaxID=320322 RepID=A0A9E7G0E9_9LILI|nr:hypothetical protein MUK42_20182 [Musa troglodytarum]
MILGCCPFVGDSFKDTYDKIVHNPLNLSKELDSELKDLQQGFLCKESVLIQYYIPWVIRDCGPIPWTSCRCKSGSFQKENEMGSKYDTTDT